MHRPSRRAGPVVAVVALCLSVRLAAVVRPLPARPVVSRRVPSSPSSYSVRPSRCPSRHRRRRPSRRPSNSYLHDVA